MADYGMIFVLLVLVLLFSALTFEQQHPTGIDGGHQVAQQIIETLTPQNADGGVIIVTRDTAEDRAFAQSAEQVFEQADINVLAIVNGAPSDARAAMQSAIDAGQKIVAIAANDVTAKWSIYDAMPSVGRDKVHTPPPYAWPNFLKLSNLLGVANQTAIYAIIAIGMTMVIITAGIDLSVGSLVAFASVAGALLISKLGGGAEASVPVVLLGMAAGIGVCALAGLFNGFLLTAFRIPPFISTLAMMMMASGLAFRLSDGRSIPDLPRSFFWLGGGVTLGIPNPVLLMIALYVIAHVVMSRMTFGRYVYAIGGNEEAARLSGVPVKRILLTVYTICGALAGLGGIILTSQLQAGDPKFGMMYELEVIAAVVVGGTSLMGGEGKIFGTLIGAFIIAVIKNGMNLTDVDPFNQKIVLGAVLLGAILLDTLKRQRSA